MRSSDLPLLLSSRHVRPHETAFPLDRVRMQKAVFLLTQRGSNDWHELYNYRPYNWGPYSSALQQDVDFLQLAGQLEVEPFAGSRYGSYRTTPEGEDAADGVWATLSGVEQSFLRQVRSYVSAKSFHALLREVYAAYPEYATKSQFSG